MSLVQRTRRAPDPAERAVLDARAKRTTDALRRHTSRGDAVFLAALGLGVIALAKALFPVAPRVMLSLFGASLVVIGALGARRVRAELGDRLAELDARAAARAASMEDITFSPVRAVTASASDGGGEAFWIFELADGTHLAFSDTQWVPGEAPPDTWCASCRVVLDGEGFVVAVHSEGDAITVTRHELRAPDFAVTDASRFWEFEGEGAPPWAVSELRLRTLAELPDA